MDASGISQVQSLVESAIAPAMTARAVNVAVLDQALDAAKSHNAALLESMLPLDPSLGQRVNILV